MFQNRIRSINRHLIASCIAILNTEVVVINFEIEIRQNQSIFNELPNDSRHLIAVKIYNGIRYFNF